jgi:hypothetical protein
MVSWWCGAAVIIAVVSRLAAWSAGTLISAACDAPPPDNAM